MAKITGPLMSVSASGSIAKRLTFSQRKSGQQVRFQKAQKDVITDARTTARANYTLAYTAWGFLNSAEKEVYNDRAKGQQLTGFNLFVKEFILYSFLDPSLVAYYPFIIGTGETLHDLSGNENNGLLKPSYPANAPSWVAGKDYKMPNALSFDGIDDYVGVGDIAANAETIDLWFYNNNVIDHTSPAEGLINLGVYDSTNYNWIALGVVTSLLDDELITVMHRENNIQYRSGYTSLTASIAVGWHHLVIVRVGGAENYRIYLDNVRVDNAYNGSGAPAHSANNVLVGTRILTAPENKGEYFDGLIARLCIYDRALSEDEFL